MAKTTCPVGAKWDRLLKDCVLLPLTKSSAQPKLVTEIQRSTPYNPAVSPAMWISVVVILNGSVLALFLWFIVYKRQARRNHIVGDPEVSLDPLYTPKLSVEREKVAPPSCPQLNGLPQTCFRQEASYHGGALGCDPHGEVGNRLICNVLRENCIPLPATELGDAALVTTKTVQCSD
ncbi:hypothetical protein UPYG_G00101440 [Umbra pygmaea]|uniref:Uncharacterized protein n=1 Tax=Umbra pygmaea TaxID=75934 RepID=A0ABD0X1Y2_UMBPY